MHVGTYRTPLSKKFLIIEKEQRVRGIPLSYYYSYGVTIPVGFGAGNYGSPIFKLPEHLIARPGSSN